MDGKLGACLVGVKRDDLRVSCHERRLIGITESIGLIDALAASRAVEDSWMGGSSNHPPGLRSVSQEPKLMQRPPRYPVLFSVKRASRGDHFHTKKFGSANSGAGKVLGDDEEGRRDGGKALCVGPPTPS